MTQTTRRRFLKQIGAMGTGLMLRSPASSVVEAPLIEKVGRAFVLTPVYNQPHAEAPITAHLPPNEPTPIAATTPDGSWYQIQGGYVERGALQPIAAYQKPSIESALGFYAEMIAAVSSIRAWCAARAPIVTTLGYGAIVHVAERLTDEQGMVWYGLAAHPKQVLIGWSPALHYARWQHNVANVAEHRPTGLQFDAQMSQLVAYQEQHVLVRLPARANGSLPKRCNVKAMVLVAQDDRLPLGTPYLLSMDSGGLIIGSYWHNHFVREPQETNSKIRIDDKVSIELPIYAARWLYTAVGSGEMAMTIE